MKFHRFFLTAFCACLLSASLLPAQDETEKPAIRRPSFGIRFEYLPTHLFSTKSGVETSTTNPIADYTYSARTNSPKFTAEPTVEYRLWGKFSVSAGLCFHHAQYQQTTTMKSGLADPNSSTDDRKATTITQTTRANYWEFPFLAHYYGLRSGRWWWSNAYISAGMELRHVGRVRTGTDYSYADGTTDYNEIPATPVSANQAGFVAGVGLRFIDSYRIKMTPEIRFIRWHGTTFEGLAYRSAGNQLEAGVGLSF